MKIAGGVIGSIMLCWIFASWYLSGLFLTLGIVDFDVGKEQELIDGFGIPNLAQQPVAISVNNVTLHGTFFHQSKATCAVILLPGIGGDRTQVLPALPLFWNFGCHVLAYDPRGTGASQGPLRTFASLEKQDNAEVIRWLVEQTDLNKTQIGIWGPSFGAAVALMTLDEVDPVGFVIADSTFSSLDRVLKDTLAILIHPFVAELITPGVILFLQWRLDMNVADVRPDVSIVGVETPVLLIHALEDPAMNVNHSRDVFRSRTNDNVKLKVSDWGAGHADSAIVDPVAYEILVREFLQANKFGQLP